MSSRFDTAGDAEVYDLAAYRLELHPPGCPCPQCAAVRAPVRTPAARPSLRPDANRIAGWCALGTAVGLLLAFVLDRLTGGPGLGVMLGW